MGRVQASKLEHAGELQTLNKFNSSARPVRLLFEGTAYSRCSWHLNASERSPDQGPSVADEGFTTGRAGLPQLVVPCPQHTSVSAALEETLSLDMCKPPWHCPASVALKGPCPDWPLSVMLDGGESCEHRVTNPRLRLTSEYLPVHLFSISSFHFQTKFQVGQESYLFLGFLNVELKCIVNLSDGILIVEVSCVT